MQTVTAKRFIMVLGLSLSLLSSVAQSGSIISNKYDDLFKQSALIGDWRLLKAQCYQESRLNPLAVSPVGAMGLCQFMPGTARDLQKKHIDLNNFWLPDVSIRAAGIYMLQMNKYWSSPRPFMDRMKLAQASYNAGAGNIAKAQKLQDGALLYDDIIIALPQVTGRHSKETSDYVKKITYWYKLTMLD